MLIKIACCTCHSICSGTTSVGEDPPDLKLKNVCFVARDSSVSIGLCLKVGMGRSEIAWKWPFGKPSSIFSIFLYLPWIQEACAISEVYCFCCLTSEKWCGFFPWEENLEQNHPSITLKARPFLVIKCLQKDALFKPFLELCMLKQRPFRLKHSCSFENEKSN